MVFEVDLQFIEQTVIAALAGGLLGVEREMFKKVVAGTRTFMLVAILGVLSVYISLQVGEVFLGLVALGVVFLSILLGVIKNFRLADMGLTTIVAFILAFVIGVVIGTGRVLEGVAMSIVSTGILTAKGYSLELSHAMSREEMKNALEFGILAFVLYPTLPDREIDPFGVINPRTLLFVVIAVALIGFMGFIAIRRYGAELGLTLTGALGGMVNSQAAVSALAIRGKAERSLEIFSFQGILLANAVMLLRNMFVAGLIFYQVALEMLPPVLVMAGVATLLALYPKPGEKVAREELPVESPFAIKPALKFGFFFTVISFLVEASKNYGPEGVYLSSFIAGFVSSGATIAGVASLASSGSLSASMAASAGVVSIVASLTSKVAITRVSGTRALSLKVGKYMLATIAVGSAVLLQTILL